MIGSFSEKALGEYTDAGRDDARGYEETNDCLRNPRSCLNPRETKRYTKELDTALSKLPKNKGGAQALYEN